MAEEVDCARASAGPAAADDDQPLYWAPSLAFLKVAGWAILLTACGVLPTILLLIPEQPLRALGPAAMIVVAAATLRLLAVGRLRASLAVLVWGTWLAVVGITLFYGGLRGSLVILYPLLIMTGGWLLGARAALALAVLTAVLISALLLADWRHWSPAPPPTPALMHGLIQLSAVIVSLLLISFLCRSYQRRIAEVRRLGQDLEQRSAELLANEAELRRAQRVAHVGSWVYDLASDTIRPSSEACRIFGVPEGSTGTLAGFMKRVHPDDRLILQRDIEAALRGEPFDSELRIIIDGGVRWVAQRAEVEFAADGRAVRSLGTAQDITARKELEASLREQKEFFQLISESIGEHIAVLDLQGRRLYNSPSYRQFFGDTSDLPGTDSFADIHPDDRARVQEAFRQTVRSGVGQELEYRLLRRDGGVRHMHSVGRVIRDQQGQPERIVVVSHDRTDRRQAEQWERIAAAAFESEQGMFITDADGIILRVNQAFTAITGYSAAEAVGQTPRLLRSGRHDALFYAAMRESLARTGAWQGEIWNRRKNDEIYPEWLTISAVSDNQGRVTHYVSMLTDITLRKATQEEIKQLAFYDALTGLPNRRLLHDRLRIAIAASARRERQGALLFIDLDNFKTLNDTLGHEKGDLLLQQVARRLSDCVRERDTVARLGGDEFVVMLEDLGTRKEDAASQSRIVGEKILAVLNRPYDLGGHEYHNTPSIGITLFEGQQDDIDELMKRADTAMYQAKAAGRNTLRFFDPGCRRPSARAPRSRSGLRHARSRPAVLPPLSAAARRRRPVIGAEALLRWQHPTARAGLAGRVHPARRGNRAHRPDRPVGAGDRLRAARALGATGRDGRTSRFRSTSAPASSTRRISSTRCSAALDAPAPAPQRLKLELTESLLLDDVEDVIAKMTCSRLGVSASRSTTSAPAIRRSPTSSACRSTS
jgi:diguanylate cyclase (GGDEF)-like protein/PAS domain S-box-containing protein